MATATRLPCGSSDEWYQKELVGASEEISPLQQGVIAMGNGFFDPQLGGCLVKFALRLRRRPQSAAVSLLHVTLLFEV
jgi:hypothetical protein